MVHLVKVLSGFYAITLSQARSVGAETSAPQYHLKTHVVDSVCPDKDNLYVLSYHTGAGLSDAVLAPDIANAVNVSLNATNLIFDIGTPYSFGITLGSDTNYAAWESVAINGGMGSPGFSFNESGLQWNGTTFAGWLACDWYHGIPQLFWKYIEYDYPLPSSCANVQLMPIPI